jgi:hypothetical protein
MSAKSTKQEIKPRGYRVAQWCEAFQTSRAAAYKMMADGRLPYVVIGGRRFIPNEIADELLTPKIEPQSAPTPGGAAPASSPTSSASSPAKRWGSCRSTGPPNG